MVAGPIVKASDFLPQLEQEQKITLKNICIGIQIFVFGLFKKIVIADNLSVFVDDVFNNPNIFSWYTISSISELSDSRLKQLLKQSQSMFLW